MLPFNLGNNHSVLNKTIIFNIDMLQPHRKQEFNDARMKFRQLSMFDRHLDQHGLRKWSSLNPALTAASNPIYFDSYSNLT